MMPGGQVACPYEIPYLQGCATCAPVFKNQFGELQWSGQIAHPYILSKFLFIELGG
jgi:hypothetical protein